MAALGYIGSCQLSQDLDFNPNFIREPANKEHAICSPVETRTSYSDFSKLSLISFDFLIKSFVTPAMAEDILQETFIEVIRKIDTYRGDAGFGFWVRRIAVNKCLMHLRSPWSSRRVDMELSDAVCPRAAGKQAEKQIILERALAELPETSRVVVWLHDVEGYTHKEIGQMMSRTTSFSKSQLARAHERLRIILSDDCPEDEEQICTPALKTY